MEHINAKAATFTTHFISVQKNAVRDVSQLDDAANDCQGTLPQHEDHQGGSRDVSPPDDADDDRQGTPLQCEDHHDGSRDVSPPDDPNNGRQGTLYQPEDMDLHGAKERRAKRRRQEEKIVTQ